jgi:hypothetical protein
VNGSIKIGISLNVFASAPNGISGSFDTPANNLTGIAGAIPVTGWALDSIEIAKVDIWREPIGSEPAGANGLVFIGDTTFVEGARPDVEATFPGAPLNDRAGWGYLMLTNFLPNNGGSSGPGNGVYKIHAIAHNVSGASLDLGTKTITADNAHANKPFGTIDTPGQGGTASGNQFVNFGWALTQNPNCIVTDGSTLIVQIDGVTLGHPVYNQNRTDIATFFPGRCNSNGAVGFFYIDTTQFTNGVHTMQWVAFDNVGHGDGLGSRYFNVVNSGSVQSAILAEPIPIHDSVVLRRGYDTTRREETLKPDEDGGYSIEMSELDRIELQLGATDGYLMVNDERRSLPRGSTLRGGVFYWHTAPGFLGEYSFLFERLHLTPLKVRVTVQPKSRSN